MKTSIVFIEFLILYGGCLAQDFSTEKEITNKVVLHFEVNEVTEIYNLFDDKMQSELPPEKLSQIWNSLSLNCGNYLGSGNSVASKIQGYVVVNQFLDFEKMDLDLRLAFNDEQKISGLFFVPPVKKRE